MYIYIYLYKHIHIVCLHYLLFHAVCTWPIYYISIKYLVDGWIYCKRNYHGFKGFLLSDPLFCIF